MKRKIFDGFAVVGIIVVLAMALMQVAAYTPFVGGTGVTLSYGASGLKISTNGGAAGFMSSTAVANGASPYTVLSGDVLILASAGAASATVLNLPAATGSNRNICVKKQDVNAFNISVTPNGADTIDGINAIDAIAVQFNTNCYNDYASGKWAKY